MIFFNVVQGRKFLTKNGFVNTIRELRQIEGRDKAFYGNRFKEGLHPIGWVKIVKLAQTHLSKDYDGVELLRFEAFLEEYARDSGFENAEKWVRTIVKLKNLRGRLGVYRVTLEDDSK